MHIAHIMLVKAEDHENAIETVRSIVGQDNFCDWSDYAIVGDEGFGSSRYAFGFGGLNDEPLLTTSNKFAISYDTEREAFDFIYDKFLSYRKAEFANLRKRVEEADVRLLELELDLEDYKSENSDKAYIVRKYCEMAEGIYTEDSRIYDLENWTTNLSYFKQSLELDRNYPSELDETSWFAVLVDFHF